VGELGGSSASRRKPRGYLKGDGIEGGVAVGGVVVEDALMDLGSGGLGNGYAVVGRERIEDVNVVRAMRRRRGSRERSCCSLRVRMRIEIVWGYYRPN
jgi:hypothetical protein